jgi:hypothetical protein
LKNSAPHTPMATVLSMKTASSAATMRSQGQDQHETPAITFP